MALIRGVSIALIVSGLALAGCAHKADNGNSQVAVDASGAPILKSAHGRAPANANANGALGIGVNGYLWRASLDTLAFMPLASADPYGGVVITDWYANPEKPDERFKCDRLYPGHPPARRRAECHRVQAGAGRARRLGGLAPPRTRPRPTSKTRS